MFVRRRSVGALPTHTKESLVWRPHLWRIDRLKDIWSSACHNATSRRPRRSAGLWAREFIISKRPLERSALPQLAAASRKIRMSPILTPGKGRCHHPAVGSATQIAQGRTQRHVQDRHPGENVLDCEWPHRRSVNVLKCGTTVGALLLGFQRARYSLRALCEPGTH